MQETTVPTNFNIIGSHFWYIIKQEENGKRLKARSCPYGHRDSEKKNNRSECSNTLFVIIRLLLSIKAICGFCLSIIDIMRANLQSGPIKRAIYVRPPPNISTPGMIL